MHSRGINGSSDSRSGRRMLSEQLSSSRIGASSARVTPSSPANLNQDKYDRFEQWLRDNGAQFELLQLCEYDSLDTSSNNSMKLPQHPLNETATSLLSSDSQTLHHEEKKEAMLSTMEHDANSKGGSELRGVYAKTYLPPNTMCMSIPRRCLITVEMGQATPIGRLIMQSDLDLDAPKHIFLMVYLLWDRKVNGPRR